MKEKQKILIIHFTGNVIWGTIEICIELHKRKTSGMKKDELFLHEMAQYHKDAIIFKLIYKCDSFQSNLKYIFCDWIK